MKILFLSLSRFDDVNVRGIYSDLMREFVKRGNDVYIASPTERRFGKPTHLIDSPNCHILKIKTLNIQKTNIIEKGIGTLLLERQFDRAIRKYWGEVNFDLVLYATPPITFNKVIERVKKRCGCRSFLMLKDIFPQNAVDLGMMKEGSLLHKMFRRKEERLYQISDRIGCMSPANCEYVIKHNPTVDPAKVELCPNAIEPVEISTLSEAERNELLSKFAIPTDKTLFIYGGNLGKPQGIDFLLKVVETNESRDNSFIVIVGSGTEFPKIKRWFEAHSPKNAKLIAGLPKNEYDNLIRACHVGLIFLDPRFTIPNFPSRLLSYLENSMPVLLATDSNTDMGRIAEREGFGLWAHSGDLDTFVKNHDRFIKNDRLIVAMGINALNYLYKNYLSYSLAVKLLNFAGAKQETAKERYNIMAQNSPLREKVNRAVERIGSYLLQNEEGKDGAYFQISPINWEIWEIAQRVYAIIPSPTFKRLILDRQYLKAVSLYPEKFGTGNPLDVVSALKNSDSSIFPESLSMREYVDYLTRECMAYIIDITDGIVLPKILRLDLFRLISYKREHDFIGGLFHALKHFTIEDYPSISKSPKAMIDKHWDSILIRIIQSFFSPMMPGKSENTLETKSNLDDNHILKGAYFHETGSPVFFLKTFFSETIKNEIIS